MAEEVGHINQRHVVVDEDAGKSMPQIVEPNLPQPQLFEQIPKVAGHIGRHHQLSQLVDADVVVKFPVIGAFEHLTI